MAKIKEIKARQILDSRGIPTIEVDVTLEGGYKGRASVPSGASTGSHEALELRDNNLLMYKGKSVLKPVHVVNEEIAPILIGQDAVEQERIDDIMIRLDGTPNKSRLGANSILAVSLAVACAQANAEGIELFEYLARFSLDTWNKFELPYPMINIINGGKHAPGSSEFQEYMIIPLSEVSFKDRLRIGAEIFYCLKQILMDEGHRTLVGDEGGFSPNLENNKKPLDYIIKAIETAGYKPGKDVSIAIDVASSEFYSDGAYELEGKKMTYAELSAYYAELVKDYPIASIEDPFGEDQFEEWAKFNKEYGSKLQIVGDDLYVTNIERLKKGIEMNASNAILIKPNQIGTLTETLAAIELAMKNGMRAIISHRSGETEDTFIADLVVGMSTGQIKTGSLSRSERVAKYNRLLRIEEYIFSKKL